MNKHERKRLANMTKGQSDPNPSNIDRLAEQIREQVNSATAIDATEPIVSDSSQPESALTAAPANEPASLTPPSAPSSLPDLASFVSNLTQEQLSRVRALAAAKGISTGPRKGPNGGLLIEVEIPEQVIEPFSVWAEAAGEELSDFVRKVAADSLLSYCFQDWGADAARQAQAAAVKPADTMKPPAAAAPPAA
jgi:hypothetical protein